MDLSETSTATHVSQGFELDSFIAIIVLTVFLFILIKMGAFKISNLEDEVSMKETV